jgi:glutamate racemase
MNVHPRSPIGVFDSGLGGLSVVSELRHELPRESILYVADSRYCPYGERSLLEIRERSLAMVEHLIERGAKLVIVACNTASAAAIEVLRERFAVPIVALEPAVKPAIALTITGKIAVLATPSTADSQRLRTLIERYGSGYDIRPVGVPGLADCVEAGEVEGPAVEALLAERLRDQRADGVDVIVLGCTHYPFVRGVIEALSGPAVRIVDSGNAVARRAREVLMQSGLLSGPGSTPALEVRTTGDPEFVRPIVERMLGAPVQVSSLQAGYSAMAIGGAGRP